MGLACESEHPDVKQLQQCQLQILVLPELCAKVHFTLKSLVLSLEWNKEFGFLNNLHLIKTLGLDHVMVYNIV